MEPESVAARFVAADHPGLPLNERVPSSLRAVAGISSSFAWLSEYLLEDDTNGSPPALPHTGAPAATYGPT
jgi:hypothetical protein